MSGRKGGRGSGRAGSKRKGKGQGSGKEAQGGRAPSRTGSAAREDRTETTGKGAGADAAHRAGEGDIAAPLARWLLWVDSPAAIDRLLKGLYVLCALLVAFELVWHRHSYVPGEELFAYHAIVGFFAFLLIVLGAKQLRRLIRRDESYYAPRSVDAEAYPEKGTGGGLERLHASEGKDAEALLRVRDGAVIGTGETRP